MPAPTPTARTPPPRPVSHSQTVLRRAREVGRAGEGEKGREGDDFFGDAAPALPPKPAEPVSAAVSTSPFLPFSPSSCGVSAFKLSSHVMRTLREKRLARCWL